ncbi:hypothetical protein GGX14DRAFT_483934, partial [Mycena pura]
NPPTSFCAAPPSTAVTTTPDDEDDFYGDDDYGRMFLGPGSQQLEAALDAMEKSEFVTSQCSRSQSTPTRPSSWKLSGGFERCTAPASCGGEEAFSQSATGFLSPVSESSASSNPSASYNSEPSSHTTLFSSPQGGSCKRKRSCDSDSDNDSDSDSCHADPILKKPKPDPDADCAPHLSQFFSSYPEFTYDPVGPISQQYQALRRTYNWNQGGKKALAAARAAYEGYNRAMGLTFSQEYGDDVDSLENWQKLCRAVGLKPIPTTLEACRKAIEDAHVNLVDLVDKRRTGKRVRRFATELELSRYTKNSKKIFPSWRAYKGGLLRYLLRRILHPRVPRDSVTSTA